MKKDSGADFPPPGDGSVSRLLGRVLEQDGVAQQKLFELYWDKLLRIARKRIHASSRRIRDEEDIALSAFQSFFAAANAGRFPDLKDRHELWGILLTIAVRKTRRYQVYLNARKRGSKASEGVSAIELGHEALAAIFASGPTPDMLVATAETIDLLINRLPDTCLRRVAKLKLDGHTTAEIAEDLKCSVRTIERKLERIGTQWGVDVE